MGGEELLRQSHGVARVERVKGRGGTGARVAAELLELLGEQHVCLPCVVQGSLELLVLFLEGLDLEPLALTGRLGGAAVAENTLYPPLLLLVLGLGSFPVGNV